MNKQVTAKNVNMYSYLGDYGGCGTIRVLYPYMLLNQHRIKNTSFTAYANAHFIPSINFYGNYTWLQFQRAATKEHLKILNIFIEKVRNQLKVPIFYEIDDHLFGIPKWNMAHDFYEKHKVYIEELMRKVDGIIVSTPKLKEVYGHLNPNIGIVENHLPMFVWGKTKPRINDTKRLRIIYPGSSNHFDVTDQKRGGDMDKTFLDFIRKTTDKYEWIFIGGFPREIIDLIKSHKVTKLPWVKTLNLATFLKDLKPDIGIAPLDTSPECLEFNESKSKIKALEFTAIGIPGVYTRIEPYKNLKCTAENSEYLIHYIEKMESPDFRLKIYQHDYTTLKDQIYWEGEDYQGKNLTKYVNTYLNLLGWEI
jgi:hypothetical protein